MLRADYHLESATRTPPRGGGCQHGQYDYHGVLVSILRPTQEGLWPAFFPGFRHIDLLPSSRTSLGLTQNPHNRCVRQANAGSKSCLGRCSPSPHGPRAAFQGAIRRRREGERENGTQRQSKHCVQHRGRSWETNRHSNTTGFGKQKSP